MDNLTFANGQFVLEASQREKIDALLQRVARSGARDSHEMLGTAILGPIKQIADYTEWTKMFFQPYGVGNPAIDVVRIAVDNPSMIAVYTSPTGGVEFVRPGRTTYVAPSYKMVETGLEIGWDDMASAGWDILGAKVKEAGEELARKRDAQGQLILDTACETVTGHVSEVNGGAMTKAAVDAIFRAAAQAKWKIDRVVVNSGTIMDMSDWIFSSAQHLWQMPEAMGNDLFRQFFVSGYGGANWYAFPEVPEASVYFAATPQQCGAYRWQVGGTRTASDINITRKTDLYSWDEKWGHYWGNPYAVWRIDVNA